MGSCEPPSIDTGNGTPVLCKSSKCYYQKLIHPSRTLGHTQNNVSPTGMNRDCKGLKSIQKDTELD